MPLDGDRAPRVCTPASQGPRGERVRSRVGPSSCSRAARTHEGTSTRHTPRARPRPHATYNRSHDGHGDQVRDDHRDRGARPAPHRVEDVLRLPHGPRATGREGRAEHAHLPGLHGLPRHAPGDQPQGRGAHHADRHRARLRDQDRSRPLRAQELLLPRPAEGLPDQPVLAAAQRQRPPGGAGPRGGDHRDHRHHPGAPRGGHRSPPARRPRATASSTSIGPGCR